MTDPGYHSEGDFALYLYEDPESENYHEPVERSHSADALRAEGRRLLKAGRFKAAYIYLWDHDDGDDTILVEQISADH